MVLYHPHSFLRKIKRKASDYMEYYVSKPSCFMHLCPDDKSEVTDELLYGTSVTFSDESYGGFVFCKTCYGYGGYVDISSLSPKKEEGTRFVVTSRFCDLYSLPEFRFSPLMTLPKGSIIEGDETDSFDERFVGISMGGKKFFAPKSCVRKASVLSLHEDDDSTRRRIIRAAFSYLNTPYRWGGKSPCGIDCSGLCFMAYSLCGLSLYRDAEFDGRYVKKIDFSDLKQADLIYYNGHVVLYTGFGEYIHSSATLGGVRTGSFDRNSPKFYPRLSSDIVCCARSLFLN